MMHLQLKKSHKALAFTLLSLHVARSAVLFRHFDELPQGVEYDFIVAGGQFHFSIFRLNIFKGL